jgi:hypothetical protein
VHEVIALDLWPTPGRAGGLPPLLSPSVRPYSVPKAGLVDGMGEGAAWYVPTARHTRNWRLSASFGPFSLRHNCYRA